MVRDRLAIGRGAGKQVRAFVKRALDVVTNASSTFSSPVPAAPIESKLSTRSEARENTVLIVSHSKKHCGINQYGLNVYEALAKSKRYAIGYVECSNEKQLDQAMVNFNPSIVVYNHYPATMPWVSPQITRKYKCVQMGIMHEVTQEEADRAGNSLFDYHLCPDPTLKETNPRIFKIPRIIPPYDGGKKAPERVRVGSFGFGFDDKGFERLIATVRAEYDEADVSILMPFNDVVDVDGKAHALTTARRCREAVTKPGINLTISHDFLSKGELLDFLAGNTVNAFFYDVHKNRGISSTIEHALAVRRPLAITKCGMFRHVSSASPSICIEDSSLKQIVANGTAPLTPFYESWTEERFTASLEKIFDKALGKAGDPAIVSRTKETPKRFNRILDNEARLEYFETIKRLFDVAPLMMKRKIQEANVQQAFVADTVLRLLKGASSPKTLCVGSHEDTATELLKAEKVRPQEIDPSINYDLNGFFHLTSTIKGSYDIVYSTSVIEHVTDDDLFVDQICKLLKEGGVGVFTCDFNDAYRPGMPKPAVDVRLYTVQDLNVRFRKILERNGCELVDNPRWSDVNPDFVYMGIYVYSFATFVFRKS